jgi:hypothetical protein
VRLNAAVLLVAGALLLSSCGSSTASDVADFDVVEPFATSVEAGLAGVDESQSFVCTSERRAVEIAVQAFEITSGRPPASEDELVPDWLRRQSTLFDVAAGVVVPADDSPCQ